ncbi:hypothetical protein [Aequorivita flava]|uniref:Uncharacterized protein n=1 Tax=Aequorivita flava TaxID=3114371 RepID=A0ABU9NDQ5_9FLAO
MMKWRLAKYFLQGVAAGHLVGINHNNKDLQGFENLAGLKANYGKQ